MTNRDDWLQRDDPASLKYYQTHDLRLSPKLFFFNVVKCKRINMQIISREERTKVSLSDKCLLNLNASKCQILHHVWCLKESSLLILFHALHHEKIWNLQADFSMWSSYLLATAPHWYMHFTCHRYYKSLQPLATMLIRKLPRYVNGNRLTPFLCTLD